MRYSSRFFLYLPFGILLLLAAVLSIYWIVASRELEKKLDALNGQAIAPGVTLHFAKREVGGFPFRLDAVMEKVILEVKRANGPMRWSAEKFALHVLSYAPGPMVFEAAGKQTLEWTGENAVAKRFEFQSASLRASAVRHDGRLSRFDLDSTGLRWEGGQALRFQGHIRRNPDADVLDFAITGDGVQVKDSPFGAQFAHAAITGTVSDADAFDALMTGSEDWRVALERWRARKNSRAETQTKISATNAQVSAKGSLWLDRYHRPTGKADAHVTLALPRLDFAQSDGADSLSASLLAIAAASASTPATVPISIADGYVRVGGLPAASAPPLY
ncbi:MAG: DUF2125 domain-containing protein [Alphaproteobacteria bacterium]|nr:DUF2125 domain-containing protein [Alphaproteobacteria bacterium]